MKAVRIMNEASCRCRQDLLVMICKDYHKNISIKVILLFEMIECNFLYAQVFNVSWIQYTPYIPTVNPRPMISWKIQKISLKVQ